MSGERRTTGISEIDGSEAEAEAEAVELERQPIGSYLRRQRKLRGISVEQLARTTRIPLRSLERLEAGSFDDEVDGFVRGFVRTVAEALGLDPDDTLARMLAEPVVDDSQVLQFSQSLPRAVLGGLLILVLAVAAGVVQLVATGDESVQASGDGPQLVRRRDPVRALAESQAAAAADRPARATPSSDSLEDPSGLIEQPAEESTAEVASASPVPKLAD